jgi:hypothetical protein
MWKSLRIGALAALVALGTLKLAQHVAATASVERLAAALAPSLGLSYGDVGGALDGRVVLDAPRLEVRSGPARGAVLTAVRATIEPHGMFALLRRALGGASVVPAALDIHLEGASLTHEALARYAREGWFGPTSLVPFESIGCDPVMTFSPRDYARMGVATRPREDDLRYSYDAATRTLRTDLVSTAPPFSTITAHLDLSGFEPRAWLGNERAERATRIEQFSLTYLDGGYLAQRNRFCAQLTGTDAAGYAKRHLAAVEAFLEARGVTPDDSVGALYRKLVAEGGSAELSSLPETTFVPADFASYAPDDLLRQLNVTLRRNTAQPILLRLGFAAPVAEPANAPPADATAVAAVDDQSEMAPAAAASSPEPEAATASVAAELPPALLQPELAPPSESLPLMSVANAAALPLSEISPKPQPAPAEEILAVATAEPEPEPAWNGTIARHPAIDPREAIGPIPASAPPPPAGTSAALVWRAPTIERLAEKPPEVSSYVSVPVASLGAYRGERVRLMTAGGKAIEGRVRGVEGADVLLGIVRDGGSALLRIPQSGIRDARVRRSAR